MMVKEAFEEARLANNLVCVEDGQELLDYLNCNGAYEDRSPPDQPQLILLDLNMPRKDGREALEEIKSNPDLRRIPVVALTTSQAEEDVLGTYNSGVSSYITKPVTFAGLQRVVQGLTEYWFELVKLPSNQVG